MAALTFNIHHTLTLWELFRPRVINRKFPESWDELTPAQVPVACRYITRDGITQEQALRLVQELIDVPWLTLCDLPQEEQYDLLMMAKYLIENITITRQLLPVIRHRGVYYYGPEELLYNCETLEFSTADGNYRRYTDATAQLRAHKEKPTLTPEQVKELKDQAEEALSHLVATLYRPGRWHWHLTGKYYKKDDRRQRFSIAEVGNRAKEMATLPAEYKAAVLMIFEGWLKHYPALYPNLYSKKGKEKETNWVSIIFECAKSAAFGTHHEVKREMIHDLLHFGETEEIKRQEAEAAAEDAKRKSKT